MCDQVTSAEEGAKEMPSEADLALEVAAEQPFRQAAPLPIPVRKRFYLTECPSCGWVGSSEQCGTDKGPWDDSDVHCPVCFEAGCEESPSESDTAEHGERVMRRILTAESEVSRLTERLAKVEAERDEARSLIADYEEAQADKRRLAREIDVAMHGEAGAARQPSLCDLVAPAKALAEKAKSLEAEVERFHQDNERLRWRHPAVMPEWNDLPDNLRGEMGKLADYYDPVWGMNLAVEIYNAMREAMMEAPHV